MIGQTQKLYCYVDETGQDTGSSFFVVVAVAVKSDLDLISNQLLKFEESLKLGNIKWHKSEYKRKIAFLDLFLTQRYSNLHIYFGRFKKPILYFFPMVETLEQTIKQYSDTETRVKVYVDGLDKMAAKKFTNALRSNGAKVKLVKGVRDESEPLIRLADRWAGCIRMAFADNEDCKRLIKNAENLGILSNIKTNPK